MNALIIDDEIMLAEGLSDLLTIEEVFTEIDICSDPKDLDTFTKNTYDFYFIDKNFSYIDGIEFVVKNLDKFPASSFIIFMSGENIDNQVTLIERPCHVVPKPFSISDVIDKVKSLSQKAS